MLRSKCSWMGSERAALYLCALAISAFLTSCGGGGQLPDAPTAQRLEKTQPRSMPTRKVLAVSPPSQIILDGTINYTKTPADVDELNGRGFVRRILVWPSEEFEGTWEHRHGHPQNPGFKLNETNDGSGIRNAAAEICNYASANRMGYVAIDLEWQDPKYEHGIENLALVTKLVKEEFKKGQCAKVMLGVYNIPYTPELDKDLQVKFKSHIDFAAPVFYFKHDIDTEQGELDYWLKDSETKRSTASNWELPIIPFVALRKFDRAHENQRLSPRLIEESFRFVADQNKFAGVIIWDCGCFGTNGTYVYHSTSPWSVIKDNATLALDQLGLTRLELAYPGSFAFGTVDAGRPYNSGVATLTNNSNFTVKPLKVEVSGDGFVKNAGSTCGSELQGHASCTIVVTFSPPAGINQSYAGRLKIGTLGNPNALSLPLDGTASVLKASLALSYLGNIDFGSASAGQYYNSSVVTLSNNGNAIVTDLRIATTSSVDGVFYTVPGSASCGASLAPGASCNFVVRFFPKPGSDKSYTGSLQISGGGTSLTRALSGTGTAPALTLSYPTEISFGSAPAGRYYNSDVTTLTNKGSETASGLSFTASGVFSIADNTCGSNLGPNSSCTFVVRFSPPDGRNESYRGSLQVAGGGVSITRPLSGTGMAPSFDLSYPASINFGSAPAGRYYNSDLTTLTNNGSVTANGVSITASGVFSIADNNCGATLAANRSCTFVIRFSPPAGLTKDYTGTLQVSGNGVSLTRALSGKGTTP